MPGNRWTTSQVESFFPDFSTSAFSFAGRVQKQNSPGPRDAELAR
jgi:hypothetical protein